MSTVQEIERALSQLSSEEFRKVELWMGEHKNSVENQCSAEDYAAKEYGASDDELKAFEQRTAEEVEQERLDGKLRKFSGDFTRDIAQ